MQCSDSDHNVIGVEVSTKDVKIGGTNVFKRYWKNFVEKHCIDKFNNEDWTGILREMNIDVANATLEEKIVKIMETEAPMSVIQLRTHYNNWISDRD